MILEHSFWSCFVFDESAFITRFLSLFEDVQQPPGKGNHSRCGFTPHRIGCKAVTSSHFIQFLLMERFEATKSTGRLCEKRKKSKWEEKPDVQRRLILSMNGRAWGKGQLWWRRGLTSEADEWNHAEKMMRDLNRRKSSLRTLHQYSTASHQATPRERQMTELLIITRNHAMSRTNLLSCTIHR